MSRDAGFHSLLDTHGAYLTECLLQSWDPRATLSPWYRGDIEGQVRRGRAGLCLWVCVAGLSVDILGEKKGSGISG